MTVRDLVLVFVLLMAGWAFAAPRPFILTARVTSGIHMGDDKYYRLGGDGLTLVTRDPAIRAHLDSFIGHEVTVHITEGHR